MKNALVIITLGFLFCATLMAQVVGDNESSRKSLKGLPGVTAIVVLNKDAEQAGLSHDQIQTDVELRLKMAGIRVGFATVEEFSEAGSPNLNILVSTLKYPFVTHDLLHVAIKELRLAAWQRSAPEAAMVDEQLYCPMLGGSKPSPLGGGFSSFCFRYARLGA